MNDISALFSIAGWIVWHSLWQLIVVWSIFTSGVRWISPSRPQARYCFLMIGLGLMALQPVFCVWTFSSPMRRSHARTENLARAASEATEPDQAMQQGIALQPDAARSREAVAVRQPIQSLALYTWQRIDPWFPFIGRIWLLGTAMFSIRMLVGYFGLHRLRRSASQPADSELAIMQRLLENARFSGSVKLARSSKISVPLAIGFLRPMILLPISLSTGLNPLELEVIIAHELAHLRRYDLWTNALQLSIETLFFYHPCVWHISREIRRERELCCDALAADTIEKRVALCRALVKLETDHGNPSLIALAACDGDLLQRVRTLCQAPSKQPVMCWSIVASGLAYAALIFSALIVVADDDATKAISQSSQSTEAKVAIEDQKDEKSETEYRVSGKIVDSNGSPISGALVVLDVLSAGKRIPSVEVRSDPNGKFEIDYSEKMSSDLDDPHPEVYLWSIADSYNVTCVRPRHSPSGPLQCEVRLASEEQIAVHVLKAAGAIVEPYHYDVPNGLYQANMSTGLSSFIPKSIVSRLAVTLDGDGKATLRGMSPQLLSQLRVTLGDLAPQDFRVSPSNVLYYELAPTGSLRGRISNFDAFPIETKKVRVSSSIDSSNNALDASSTVSCSIDATGHFRAYGLVAGPSTVDLSWGPSEKMQPNPSTSPTILAGEEVNYEIELVPGVEVVGSIVASDLQEPVRKARIFVSSTNAEIFGHVLTTTDQGQFAAFLAPGRWKLQVFDLTAWDTDFDYKYPSVLDVSVLADAEKLTIEPIKLTRMPIEEGRVIDRNGKPIANQSVAWISMTFGFALKFGTTDEAGHFKVKVRERRGVEKGKWIVYPENVKPGTIDGRELPPLLVKEESPWLLVSENAPEVRVLVE